MERKSDKLCLATPLLYNSDANHCYKNAAVELKSLEIYFCRACDPSIFLVSMTTDLMLHRQLSLTLAGCHELL